MVFLLARLTGANGTASVPKAAALGDEKQGEGITNNG
jgi:hypothetical protein